MKKRFHELDMENKKLAHDREELARAYKVHKKTSTSSRRYVHISDRLSKYGELFRNNSLVGRGRTRQTVNRLTDYKKLVVS